MIKTLYDPAIVRKAKIEYIIELLEDYGEIPEKLINEMNKQKDLVVLSKWHKIAAKVKTIKEFEEKVHNK